MAEWEATSIGSAIRSRFGAQLAQLSIPTELPRQMAIVQARWRSNRASARAVGVDERTWRRWLAGTTRPRPASAGKLARSARVVRALSIVANFRRVWFTQEMGGRVRQRDADARALRFHPTANDRITDAVRQGQWGRAAWTWINAIRDETYRQLFDPIDGYLDAEYGLKVTRMDI